MHLYTTSMQVKTDESGGLQIAIEGFSQRSGK